MANAEHLKIIKSGLKAWYEWREINPEVIVDLRYAELFDIDLGGVKLLGANLRGANLRNADLRRTDFSRTTFAEADLRRANLNDAILTGADFSFVDFSDATLAGTNLNDANLSGAKLIRVNLSSSSLRRSNLSNADLEIANLGNSYLSNANLGNASIHWTDFSGAILDSTDFTNSRIGSVIFGDVNLRNVIGLETITHSFRSTIGIDTIYRSGGKVPEVFLRGCGVPDQFITYMGSLVNQPIEYYSCFISYSSKDTDFAERLYADLQNKGVRCWFAPEDIKIGDKFRQRIDESIRFHDKLLLILSENSLNSPWVENEVESALEREHKEDKTVLFPVRMDDSVMDTTQAWAASLRRTRHIGDFSEWKHHDHYQNAFARLVRDLKA